MLMTLSLDCAAHTDSAVSSQDEERLLEQLGLGVGEGGKAVPLQKLVEVTSDCRRPGSAQRAEPVSGKPSPTLLCRQVGREIVVKRSNSSQLLSG